ncbi:MAG: substrate-binding periplasmic protein [Rhodospirillaceae bacterium]
MAVLFGSVTRAQAADPLILNTEEYPPLNYTDPETGDFVGLATELVHAMMDRAGIAYEVRNLPWKRAYGQALNQEDTCVFSTARTPEREALFQWIGPLATSEWAVFALADSAIEVADVEGLKDHRVGGYAGDAKSLYLVDKGIAMDLVYEDPVNIRKLQQGRIDLWAASSLQAPMVVETFDVEIRKVMVFHEIPVAMACNKAVDPALVETLRAALADLQADGTVAEVTARYLGP